MTRRHYERTADILARALADADGREARALVYAIAADMVAMFAADNPRFNGDRWLARFDDGHTVAAAGVTA